jgi:hypothetical protein
MGWVDGHICHAIDRPHTFKKNLLVDLSGRMTERRVVVVQFEEPAFSEDRS